ncbi:MAG: substrate-binding domain-containing protein [Spirochaetales bacterium]|nr:substrate-binding domain-containing protein [Spirochaetales bacterium]
MPQQRPRIGLLFDFLLEEYQLKIWSGMQKAAEDHDLNLYCFLGGELEGHLLFSTKRNTAYDLVAPSQLDGVIIVSAGILTHISKKKFNSFYEPFTSIPNVSIGVEIEGCPSLLVDNAKGIIETVEHLVEEHHYRRIAFIKGPENNPEAKERYTAYKKALAQYNLEFDPGLVAPGYFTIDAGKNAVSIFFDRRKMSCDAIIACCDLTALGAIDALQQRNIRVPEDVAIVGFDNSKAGRFTKPQLTTVHQPITDLGCQAVDMLLTQIKGFHCPKRTMLPTHLRIRRSCGCSFESKAYFFTPAPGSTGSLTPGLLQNIKHELIQEVARKIEKYVINPTRRNSYSSWIENLVEDYFTSLLKSNEEIFLNTLENTIAQVEPENIDIFCWRRILAIPFDKLLSLLSTPKDIVTLLNLWKRASEFLWEIEMRDEAEYEAKAASMRDVVISIGQELLSLFNTKKFTQIIDRLLPRIGINRFYITIYTDSDNSFTNSRFIHAYENAKSRRDLLKRDSVETESIITLCFKGKRKRECLIILPLFVQHESLGFFILEHNNLEGLTYLNIAIQLSNALKGARIVDGFSRQTEYLSTSNKEKETLLKEIHHRVKNNLQVIYSFLNLQRRQTSNKEIIDQFKAIQNRVKSMAILHEQLYRDNDFSKLNLKHYLKSLINYLKISYSSDINTSYIFDEEEININFERAIPLGLVVNELVSNSLKHAFNPKKTKKPPEIEVICRHTKGKKIFLSIHDNGSGFDKGFDIRNTTSLGMQIVYNIINNQLEGKLDLVFEDGPRFNIHIPLPE